MASVLFYVIVNDYFGEGVLDLMSLRVVKLVEFHQLDVLILVVFIGVILSV